MKSSKTGLFIAAAVVINPILHTRTNFGSKFVALLQLMKKPRLKSVHAFIITFIFMGMVNMCFGQEQHGKDSILGSTPVKADAVVKSSDTAKRDTVALKKRHKMSEPDKAALMSAIIPGLGQVGHHDSWWHVPIIYAGFGVLGYFIVDNNKNYQLYRYYYQVRLKHDADTTVKIADPFYWRYTSDILNDREYFQRNRDLSIILAVVWYASNIIDAYVSAQLRDFDISNDLSMHLEPVNLSLYNNQPYVTCGLKFNLK